MFDPDTLTLAGFQRLLGPGDHPGGLVCSGAWEVSGGNGLLGCTQFRPGGTGGAMLWVLCLALCGLLTRARAEPGALLRLGMDIMNHGELVGPGLGVLGGRVG